MGVKGRHLAVAALGVGAAGLAAVRALRPWFAFWGATEEEVNGPWPVDDLVPVARSPLGSGGGRTKVVATRAINIDAPPDQVWPWIVQIGQDRAGFYSYNWLENLVGADIHNLDHIEPDFQHRKVGDTVWLSRPDRFKGMSVQKVAMFEPNRVLALVSSSGAVALKEGFGAEGAWCFLLTPRPDGTTRLVVRTLGDHAANVGFDLVHFVMERKMMTGIKARAERRLAPEAPAAQPT